MSSPRIDNLRRLLSELLEAIPDPIALSSEEISPLIRRKLMEEIGIAISRLGLLREAADPIRLPTFVFDPSNPEFVGQLVGRTLIEQPAHPLANVHKFYGSGVYALYYHGAFAAYRPVSAKTTPIYVGKADPPTPDAKNAKEQGTKLWTRLTEHAKSVRLAGNLDINDFRCRYLVVQSGWQRSAEDYLIHRFTPIWNQSTCYGFGKHGDDPSTRANTRSPWDTLHSGRPWATRSGNKVNPLTSGQVMEGIADHYRRHPPEA